MVVLGERLFGFSTLGQAAKCMPQLVRYSPRHLAVDRGYQHKNSFLAQRVPRPSRRASHREIGGDFYAGPCIMIRDQTAIALKPPAGRYCRLVVKWFSWPSISEHDRMRSLTVCVALFTAGVFSSTHTTNAEDWTRFHGPNGTGESEATTIPASWGEVDYNWIAELPGMGHSSPVIWGKRLFILSADPKTATRYMLCYDAEKGKEIWRRDFESAPHHLHTMSSFASCTPTVDEERVYIAWSTPASLTFKAFTHNGDLVWEQDLGPWYSQHGFGTSPIVYEDLVILSKSQEAKNGPEAVEIPPESFVIAFDRRTGEERWKTRRITDSVSYSVPAILQPTDGHAPQLVNISTGSGMYALDPKTGDELWSSIVFDKRTVSSPLIKGNLIFGSTGSGGGGNYLSAVRCDGKEPKVAYQIKVQAPYVPSVVAKGDLLFMVSDGGIATCVDLSSGEVHWRERLGGNYQASPVRAADKIYCVSVEGNVVVLAAKKEFEELGRVPLGEGSRSTPAIADGRLFLRTFSKLMSIGGMPDAKSASANAQ